MAIVSISRVQVRRGLRTDLPNNLNEGELGFCLDTRQLFIGNGPGFGGNTELLTQYSDTTGALNITGQLIAGTLPDQNINITSIGNSNVVISNLVVTGSTAGVTTNYVPPETGGQLRTQQDKLHDIPSLKDWAAIGDGSTDNTIAVQYAEQAAEIVFVPQGRYVTALSANAVVQTAFWGPGQIVLGGFGQARNRAVINSEVTDTTQNIGQYFDQGWDRAISTQYVRVSNLVGQTATYNRTLDTAAMTGQLYDYAGGINVSANTTINGRTFAAANFIRTWHSGQGDVSVWNVTGTQTSTNTNATYVDALPKTQIMQANLVAAISNVQLAGSTISFVDQNFDISVVGNQTTYNRNIGTASLSKHWIHDRPTSTGLVTADVAYNPVGNWSKLWDATGATLDINQAAIVLSANQRIYFNAVNSGDAQGNMFGATNLGNVTVKYNNSTASLDFTVGSNVVISLTQLGKIISNSLAQTNSFTNDAAAAAGNVQIGEFYRSGSAVMIRVS